MSKTPITMSLKALTWMARPCINETPAGKKWKDAFTKLVAEIEKYDIITKSGLTHSGTPSKVIGKEPLPWILSLLKGEEVSTIQSGRKLGLDDKQDKLPGTLNIASEEAIVLEDRWSSFKMKDTDTKDMTKIPTLIQDEWTRAVGRRRNSTNSPETDIAAISLSEWDTYLKLYESIKELLGKVSEKIDKNTMTGWEQELDKNLLLIDIGTKTYITNLKKLQREIIDNLNAKQKIQNDASHEWIEARYRNIIYTMKDENNYHPILRIIEPNVYVKKGNEWIITTESGGYYQYNIDGSSYKIEMKSEGVVYYYKTGRKWKK